MDAQSENNGRLSLKRVVGIGETVMDILFKDDRPLKAVPGGSAFNSVVSLGRAGVPCVMVTEVGDDHIGEMTCQYLRDSGVSDEFVRRRKGAKSHLSLAFMDEHNDAQYIFYKDHASATLEGVLPQIQADDVVLFGSFFAINPVIRPTVRAMLREARKAGAWMYYDVNFRKTHIADIPAVMADIEENMRLADVVRGSMEDFGFLYGETDTDAVYGRVRPFCRTLILTDGPRCIRVYSSSGCDTYPVPPVETVSTVGAGDNFNAGYIYAVLRGIDVPSQRIAMAQRWSQDVCRRLDNNISDELLGQLR